MATPNSIDASNRSECSLPNRVIWVKDESTLKWKLVGVPDGSPIPPQPSSSPGETLLVDHHQSSSLPVDTSAVVDNINSTTVDSDAPFTPTRATPSSPRRHQTTTASTPSPQQQQQQQHIINHNTDTLKLICLKYKITPLQLRTANEGVLVKGSNSLKGIKMLNIPLPGDSPSRVDGSPRRGGLDFGGGVIGGGGSNINNNEEGGEQHGVDVPTEEGGEGGQLKDEPEVKEEVAPPAILVDESKKKDGEVESTTMRFCFEQPSTTNRVATNTPPPPSSTNITSTTSNEEENIIYHTVEPSDSLRWICLKYKVTAPAIRAMNDNFIGNNLKCAPKILRIPSPTSSTTTATGGGSNGGALPSTMRRRLSNPRKGGLKNKMMMMKNKKTKLSSSLTSSLSSPAAIFGSDIIVPTAPATTATATKNEAPPQQLVINNVEDDNVEEDDDANSLAPAVGGGNEENEDDDSLAEDEDFDEEDFNGPFHKPIRYKDEGGGITVGSSSGYHHTKLKSSTMSIDQTERLSRTADMTFTESDTIGTCDTNGILYHDIRPGDTLDLLCQKYNITASDLRSCNIGLVGSNVQAGPKRLIIPPARNVPNKKLFRKSTTGSDTTSSAEGDADPSSVPTEVDLILSPLDNDDGEGGKKIMAEAYAVVYHDRQPSDTLQSICFQYNVTADKIRRANNFRGNDLVYAPDRLVIPITTPKSTPETELTNDEKVESLQSQLSKLSLSRDDAVSFLELNDWNLSRTVRNVNVQKRYFSNNKRE